MDMIEALELDMQPEQLVFNSEREQAALNRLLPLKDGGLSESDVEQLVGFKPDVVVVLAGGVKVKAESESMPKDQLTPDDYVTPLFTAGTDNVGLITGARYRGIAAAIIARAVPTADVQTNSINTRMGIRPVDVVARELEEMGVERTRIVKETSGKESESTFGNVARLIEQLGTHEEWHNVAIVTNEYHIARAQETVRMVVEEAQQLGMHADIFDVDTASLRYLKKEELTPEFMAGVRRMAADEVQLRLVACEDVIKQYDPEFESDFAAIQRMPEYMHRVSEEARGAADFRAGRYVRSI